MELQCSEIQFLHCSPEEVCTCCNMNNSNVSTLWHGSHLSLCHLRRQILRRCFVHTYSAMRRKILDLSKARGQWADAPSAIWLIGPCPLPIGTVPELWNLISTCVRHFNHKFLITRVLWSNELLYCGIAGSVVVMEYQRQIFLLFCIVWTWP